MDYTEALQYIHSVAWMGSRPGLSRTRELLSRLGDPQNDMAFLHVTGTNGKGSTCAMCESVLREAGYKTGLYTSPFIVRFNERMRVCGQPISDFELAELVEIIKPHADSMTDKPTEFELITAIAFLYFKRHRCDIVVLEVGMGGRLDSTNVIESPVASVITGVALDHTDFLGSTVREIAFEKAGIIKKEAPVVFGGDDEEALEVIESKASETLSTVYRVDRKSLKTKRVSLDGTVFDYREYEDLELSLCGSYQPQNAATAIEALRAIAHRFPVSDDALKKGLKLTKWQARFEKLGSDPPVVFDGSHNIQGVTVALDSMRACFQNTKVNLIMGVLADKEYAEMVHILAPQVDRVFCVTPPSPRALSASDLASVWSGCGIESSAHDDYEAAVSAALCQSKINGRPLVMLGSLYMYGSLSEAFYKMNKFK